MRNPRRPAVRTRAADVVRPLPPRVSPPVWTVPAATARGKVRKCGERRPGTSGKPFGAGENHPRCALVFG